MSIIQYDNNPNRKLLCKYFVEILPTSSNNIDGWTFEIQRKTEQNQYITFMFADVVRVKKNIKLNDIPDVTLMLSTGETPNTARELIKNKYNVEYYDVVTFKEKE